MDPLKRQRAPIRASFTKLCTQIDVELGENIILERSNELLDLLTDKHDRLANLDSQIITILTEDDAIEADIVSDEYETIELYREKYISIKRKLADKVNKQREIIQHPVVAMPGNTNEQRKFRLPEIELKRFDGNVKEWLTFWGQFRKIHDDKEIAPEDKFQYLSQSMVEGSRPKEIVNSYPATATSYDQAIDALKSRYGRDDVLIDVYIRELLKLINRKNSKSDLSQLYDKIETQLRALETLGVVKKQYAIMLFPMVESCLPEEIIKAWERQRSLFSLHADKTDGQSNLQLLMNFLRHEVESEERVKLARNTFETRGSNQYGSKSDKQQTCTAADLMNSSNNNRQPRKFQCLFCDKGHSSHECFRARRMTLEEKRQIISAKRACFSCLNLGHPSKFCKAQVKCMLCEKRHHTIMCAQFVSHQASNVDKKATDDSATLANDNLNKNVLLQTVQVKVEGSNGRNRMARALIDTGSQRSYITNAMAREMGYQIKRRETLKHGLFGGHVSEPREHKEFEVHLANPNTDYRCQFNVLDNPEICKYADSIPRGAWITELDNKNIKLSDYGHTSKQIEILIGADVAGKLFTGNMISLESGPVAIETQLGWTLMGKISDSSGRNSFSTDSLMVTSLFVNDCTIQDLWKLDVLGITDNATKVENEKLARDTTDHFLKTVKSEIDGRYQVRLPWVEGHPPLPDNNNIAVKRLQNTTKKLKDSKHFDEYDAIFEGWIKEGIIEEVKPETINNECHYLPHRPVIKEGSSTKMRPVFDASARKDNRSPSLNDCLSKGPNLIEIIPKILMKFRQKRIGVSADIKAAFLQISLNEDDRDYLRFMWWKDSECREIKLLRHTRVVFGVASSPFLLAATINYHLDNAPKHLEATAIQLREAFYVDNCLTSVDNERELTRFIAESSDLMKSAQFELRRWEFSGQSTQESALTNALGLVWDKQTDTLTCDTHKLIEEFSGPLNKRALLSTTHKIFDPIGFTCPITIPPRMLLQETWELKLNWNQELPPDIKDKYTKWKEELPLLEQIKIPRRLNMGEGDITLHTFCDASKNAYACCVFIRNESSQKTTVELVQAKNRITPIKNITIPRLELLSCLIGARLTHEVNQTLKLPKDKIFFWSDSTTALSWIDRQDQWGAFVWNRVNEIHELTTGSTWRHVPGTHNPADLPSRGIGVKKFVNTKWWEGPEWMKRDMSSWPTSEQKIDEQEVCSEKRKTIQVNLTTPETLGSQIINTRFSKFKTMVKVVAWIKRFVHNCKNPATKTQGGLCVAEIKKAELHIVRLIQNEAFTQDQMKSMKKIHLEKTDSGLLTVKSRLTARRDTDVFITPVLLPSRHSIVEKIILDAHLSLSHAGVNITLSQLREKYWILRGRKTVARVISHCQICRRFTAKPMTSNPPALPADRVNDAAVFEISGVDLAGPLYLKGGKKAWIVVFTCAVYRAIHLELVTSLSTEAFLQALERFTSRRGRPRTIYSDNATNFIGANNILKFEDDVIKATVMKEIEWKFIPPLSPWWGGWWERMIRMIKNIMRRVLGKSILKYEEMNTILCNIEAIVNSRPLTYMSEDSNDYLALTPALFLNEIPSGQVVDTELINQNSLSKRFKYKIKLLKDLKQRFRREYLSELMQFSTKRNSRPLKKGDLVFVNNDAKRLQWPLARVLEVFPGKDGFSRVAKIKTEFGVFTRSIQRLHPLEVHEQMEAKTLVTRSGRISRKPERLKIN